MNLADFLKECLKEKGFDGLQYEECGCTLDAFIPCGECCLECEPAYQHIGGKDGHCHDCEKQCLIADGESLICHIKRIGK